MEFEVVEIPWSAIPEDWMPEDIEKMDYSDESFEVFASFRYDMHAKEWADQENRVWDAGRLVVRKKND